MKMSRKITSFFLAMVVLLGLVPLSALAADSTLPSSPALGTSNPTNSPIAPAAIGDTFSLDGIKYKIIDEDVGIRSVVVVANTPPYAGNIVIPQTVTHNDNIYTVTQISAGAFSYSNVTSVTLPAGMVVIGGYAFKNCTALTSINLPAGITYIELEAFQDCTSLTSINLPDGIAFIGEAAFKNCKLLTSIIVPSALTYIRKNVFYGCTNLTSVTFPPALEVIGDIAFRYCTSLTSVTFPAGLTSIGGGAFEDCTSIATLAFLGEEPPNFPQYRQFANAPIATVNVPAGSKAAYEARLDGRVGTAVIVGVGYIVTFDPDGGILTDGKLTQTITHGAGATAPTVTKDGHTFTGWDNSFDSVTTDLTITAQWDPDTYTVTFNPDGGILTDGKLTQTITHGGSATAPTVTKDGHTLTGWDNSFDSVTTDLTITAQWTQNTYTVTFNPDGGILTGGTLIQTIIHGDSATAPTVTKDGHTFTGWDNSFDSVTSDLTVTAQWTQNTYTVTFDPDGGIHTGGTLTQTIIHGDSATAPTVTKDGHTFTGWDNSFDSVTSDLTVTAQWTQNTYTVTFNPDGGTLTGGTLTQTITHGGGATAPTVTKDGHTLTGWDKSFDSVTSDLTVTAQWAQNTYTVTFDPDGGSLTGGTLSQTITHGNGATAPTVTKDGYTFDGWDINFSNITTNITVTAKWAQNTYTVTFNPDGGILTGGTLTQTITHDDSATAPTVTKDGYTFDGWDINFSNITTNITVTATWKQNTAPIPDPTQPSTIITRGRSSSGGGGSSKADVSAVAGKAFTLADATKLFNAALANLPAGATTLSIKAANFTSVDKTVLAELGALAQKNGVTLTAHFDTTANNSVTYRVSINPATITTNLDLTVKIAGNKITMPKFTAPVEVAVKTPAGVTMESLKITGNGKDITATSKPWQDKNGYLHFATTGGDLVLAMF